MSERAVPGLAPDDHVGRRSAEAPGPLGWRRLAAVLLFGGSLLFALSASGKSFNYHEARYAQGAREMLESGEWLVPTIGGRPRLQKPPLVYWSMAAAMAAFGSAREWPARLPSVLAALLTAVLVADLAGRRFGPTDGLLVGLAQTSFVYVLVSGQLADPDLLLTAMVTAGMWSFARGALERRAPRRGFATVFWAAAGLAFLDKGPIGPVLLVPAAVLFAAATRRRKRIAFFLAPGEIALFAFLVVAWPVAAYLAHPDVLGAWLEENVSRFRGDLGSDPPLFYLYNAPWMVLPWTPFAVLGAWSVWREGDRDPLWGLAFSWLTAGLLILSASAGKHDRYLAPVLPPVALFVARGLRDAAPFARRPGSLLAGALAAEWLIAVGVQRLVALRFDEYGPRRELARRLSSEVPAGAPLFLVAIPNNVRTQLLYYVRRPVEIVGDARALGRELSPAATEAWIVTPESTRTDLRRLGEVAILDRAPTRPGRSREADRLTLMRLRPSSTIDPSEPEHDDRRAERRAPP